ncbi:hypothetical protein [Acidimangrovimonas sediminis]|uniref:hypothetical protein n=1 Tax=Acidimangrovimonas sediminis TaxID=2056283 RepID=UPI000C802342|nr:hypothetical protein [Acidimangrovimonas sediminis]
MQLMSSILKELYGLFVDDGSLALQLVVLIAVLAALAKSGSVAPLPAAFLLILGCIAILGFSLHRMTRR